MAAKGEIDTIIPPQYTTEYRINGHKGRIRHSDEFVNVRVFETTGMLAKPVVEVNGKMEHDTYGLAKKRHESRQRIANGQGWQENGHNKTKAKRAYEAWLRYADYKSNS